MERNFPALHKILFIRDLLAAKRSQIANSESAGFEFGKPPAIVHTIRVGGVVVGVCDSNCDKIFTLDDSTGVIQVHLSEDCYVEAVPRIGAQVDFLGTLEEDGARRIVRASTCTCIADASWEPFRYMQMMKLYREVYFASQSVNPKNGSPGTISTGNFEGDDGHHLVHVSDAIKERNNTQSTVGVDELLSIIAKEPQGATLEGLENQTSLSSPLLRDMLDNMMIQGLVYESGGRFKPL